MLGGGLKSEFEEIDKALQQYRASAGSRATATLPFDFDRVRGSESRRRGGPDNRSPIPAGSLNANDRSGQGHERDWFSRELGEMVRSRSQSLAASDQDDSELIRQQEKSRQPVVGQGDTRGALRQCAQQLEAVAASLEQVEAYENADSVRREAAQLWEKARHP